MWWSNDESKRIDALEHEIVDLKGEIAWLKQGHKYLEKEVEITSDKLHSLTAYLGFTYDPNGRWVPDNSTRRIPLTPTMATATECTPSIDYAINSKLYALGHSIGLVWTNECGWIKNPNRELRPKKK